MSCILVCPFYAVGHVTPTLILAKKLASQGIKVIYIFPGKELYERVAEGKDLDSLGIEFQVVDFHDEFEKETSGKVIAAGLRKVDIPYSSKVSTILSTRLQTIRQNIDQLKSFHNFSAAIIDFLMVWEGILMKDLGFPVYTFSPVSGMCIATTTHLLLNGIVDEKGMFQNPEYIEHLPVPLRPYDFSVSMNTADPFVKTYQSRIKWAASTSGFIINTFEEMEEGPLKACRKLYKEVFAVGPLLEDEEGAVFRSGQEKLCKDWLDKQSPKSVLFICFGSWLQLTETQLQELAFGVEESCHKFLWILQDKSEEFEWMKDFQRRTSTQGLTLSGWGPQQLILSHPSVGGFIATCGWNSVLESIGLGGVPLIAWPLFGDHLPTCRYLVDGAKVAVEVEDQDGLVNRHEVVRAIKRVMTGSDLHARAEQLKQASKDAAARDGSSDKAIKVLLAKASQCL